MLVLVGAGQFIAAVRLEDMVAMATEDAVFICPRIETRMSGEL